MVENAYSQEAHGGTRSMDDASVHNIVGAQATVAKPLRDVDHTNRMMFLYPDLSVRLPGRYSIRFQLVDVSSQG
ncbi:hypothetical protein HKX48_002586, partial [Thoreauomyces humboldtii]